MLLVLKNLLTMKKQLLILPGASCVKGVKKLLLHLPLKRTFKKSVEK